MTSPVLTLEEEDFLCEQAELLHAREAKEKERRDVFLAQEWVLV